MNKTAIKNYAIWARVQLIESAKQRAYEYEITENGENNPNLETIGGRLLSKVEKEQRQQLINQIRQKGYTQVMEEAAYTWFNRFIALRFMEVNGYLPSKVRVFTDENNAFKPEILKEAMSIELEGLDRGLVFELLDKQDNETLYKTLLIAQCNALNTPLPYMFERINNWTELLFPENLLRADSIIGRLISDIDIADWNDEVEIIGWFYQYYISEKHEEVVNPLYGKGIKKEDIPAATQLFTTDWIVRYMVDNSLGRYWIERTPESKLAEKLDYYVPPRTQFPKVHVDPTQITFFDPCLGSGHILSYAFDVFMEIYRECGFTDRDATEKILNYNLYGLDIDDRAFQLASFALMMKARRYNRRILATNINLNIASIQESNNLPDNPIYEGASELIRRTGKELMTSYKDAKEIGSLLAPTFYGDLNAFEDYLTRFDDDAKSDLAKLAWNNSIYSKIRKMVVQTKIFQRKYTIVCTNPPYMNNLKGELKKYIFTNYKDYSGDIFSAFIVRNLAYTQADGYASFMTPNVWMYIKSFEKLRNYLFSQKSITSFLLLAKGAFYKEATVDICSFVVSNSIGLEGIYIRLEQYKGDMEKQKNAFLNLNQIREDGNLFYRFMKHFTSIPGSPLAFWISDKLLNTFNCKSIDSITTSKAGIVSGDDAFFLRLWYEIDYSEISLDAETFEDQRAYKWVPINKGGAFRRYYGNYEYIINIYDLWNSPEKVNESVRRSDPGYYFKKALTWSYVTTGKSSFRYTNNKTSATAAPNLFFECEEDLFYTLAFTNCCITQNYLDLLNPTINLNVTNVSTLPIIIDEDKKQIIIDLCKRNIECCKEDWDAYETSWDFQQHPLVAPVKQHNNMLLSDCYNEWEQVCFVRFTQLKANEEELNRIFIDIYGLVDELTPYVDSKDVTVRKADLGSDIRSLISYAVGCMLGRYSLDKPGLAFAGGAWDASQYTSYMPDHDGILPITDDEYFDDDIVGMFVNWVRTVYGEETLEANLKFIADALGGKGTPREAIRTYFLNDFYADHLKTYQKRPIYWLFSSGKKNGFKCLIYMHRYQPDLLARIRTDYVHEQQERYRTQLTMLEDSLQTASASERVKLNKQIVKIKDQALELQKYEEKIHHLADQMISIDLDDGVKVNYAKFQDVLEKIK